MINKKICPTCNKVAVLESESRKGRLRIRKFKCGHLYVQPPLRSLNGHSVTSKDGKTPYEYQKIGAEFIINAEGRALIADEMGLGKTVQALIPASVNRDQLTPFLVVCKSGLKMQWLKETMRWTGMLCQIIDSENEPAIPGMDGFIISMDLLWRFGTEQATKTMLEIWGQPKDKHEKALLNKRIDNERTRIQPEVFQAFVERLQIKYVILDEVQHMKNTESKRTNAVRLIANTVDNLVALSGTPIKNHAGEYFPVLNMLHPDRFPTLAGYERRWCEQYFTGFTMKTGGLKDPIAFQEYTKDFIIRRTRKQVLPDLPTVTRDFRYSELGEKVQKAYDSLTSEFEDFYNFGRKGMSALEQYSNILGFFSKMRYLTGMSKIESVANMVDEFITSTDRKIVIFLHHQDADKLMTETLENYRKEWPSEWGDGILHLRAEMSPVERNNAVEKFHLPNYRVLVASTLAAGEGLNLQCCSDCIMMERQWNPANEEQAEARFIRIGQQATKVTATYCVAVGTIDEFLSELVEKKRSYMASTLDGKKIAWDQSSLVMELAEILSKSGRRKWSF